MPSTWNSLTDKIRQRRRASAHMTSGFDGDHHVVSITEISPRLSCTTLNKSYGDPIWRLVTRLSGLPRVEPIAIGRWPLGLGSLGRRGLHRLRPRRRPLEVSRDTRITVERAMVWDRSDRSRYVVPCDLRQPWVVDGRCADGCGGRRNTRFCHNDGSVSSGQRHRGMDKSFTAAPNHACGPEARNPSARSAAVTQTRIAA